MKKCLCILITLMMISISFSAIIGNDVGDIVPKNEISDKTVVEEITFKGLSEQKNSQNNNANINYSYSEPDYGSLNEGSLIYNDDKTWWLFTPTSENEATIVGAWFTDKTMTDLEIPNTVKPNACIDTISAEYKISFEGNVVKYKVLELDVVKSGTTIHAKKYVNLEYREGGKSNLQMSFDELADEPVGVSVDAILVGSNTSITISGVRFVSASINNYDKDLNKLNSVPQSVKGGVFIPQQLAQISSGNSDYSVTAVGDYAVSVDKFKFQEYLSGDSYTIYKAIEKNWMDGLSFTKILIPKSVKYIGKCGLGDTNYDPNSALSTVKKVECEKSSCLEYIGEYGLNVGTWKMQVKNSGEINENALTSYVSKTDFSDFQTNPEVMKVAAKVKADSKITITIHAASQFVGMGMLYSGPAYVAEDGAADAIEDLEWIVVNSEDEDFATVEVDTTVSNAKYLVFTLHGAFIGSEQSYVYLVFEIESEIEDHQEEDNLAPTEMTLPRTVKYLAKGSLQRIQKLSIEEGPMLEYIGDDALGLLNPLFPVTLPNTVKQIGVHEDIIKFGQYRYVPHPFNPKSAISFDAGGRYSTDNGYLLDGMTVIGYFGTESVMQLPQSAKKVAERAFYKNPALKTVEMTNDVVWGEYAFDGVDLDTLTFDSTVKEIPKNVFNGVSVPKLTIPANVETIGFGAFRNADIDELLVDDESHLTLIDVLAFECSTLRMATFGTHAEGYECTFENSCFGDNKNLTEVILSKDFKLVYIGSYSFHKQFKDNEIPNSNVATFNSKNGISIPSTVAFIGLGAFSGFNRNEGEYPIVFEGSEESPSQLYQIMDGAFSSVRATSVDLSKCSALEKIYYGNFSDNSITNVKFPEHCVLKLCLGFNTNRSIMETMTIPATVKCFGCMEIADNIVFAEGSQLKTFLGVRLPTNVDMTACHDLEYLGMSGNLTVPEGVYTMVKGRPSQEIIDEYELSPMFIHNFWQLTGFGCNISNSDSVILSEGQTIIGPETKTINRSLIGSSTFTGSNDMFSVEDGLLVYSHDGKRELAGPADKDLKKTVISKESPLTGIMPKAFSGTAVDQLYIYKDGISTGAKLFDGNSTANAYLLCNLGSLDMDAHTFSGIRGEAAFFVINGDSPVVSILQQSGKVFIGFTDGGKTVFMPEYIGGMKAVYSKTSDLAVSVMLPNGYCLYDIEFSADGASFTNDARTLRISSNNEFVFAEAVLKDRTVGSFVNVVFDPSGGDIAGGTAVRIPKGLSVIDAEIPKTARDGFDLSGWYLAGTDTAYDFDSVLENDVSLIAHWTARAPIVTIDTPAGIVYLNGNAVNRIDTGKITGEIRLKFAADDSFEAFEWIYATEGRVYRQDVALDLVLDPVSDVSVTVDYRYYSRSTGLPMICKTGLLTNDDIGTITKSWEAGGILDKTGDRWKGHSSVPLIVDNYVYLRIGDRIYKLESDTGYIVKSVQSYSTDDFYHNIGYGGGAILDYYTDTVFDLDLNKMYELNRHIKRADYYDGYFYSSDKTVYRFPSNPSLAENGIMAVEKVGEFPVNVYSNYSYSSSVFKDGYLYRTVADGRERGIAAMCVNKNSNDYGGSSYKFFDHMRGQFLDDGWITEYKGVFYIQGYTNGLFGSSADADVKKDVIGYVKADGLAFGEPSYIDLTSMVWPSGFVVANGYGFFCDGYLHVYKMNADGTPGEELARKTFTVGHGGMVIDVSRATQENGYLTYAYEIPYEGENGSLFVAECYDSGHGYKIRVTRSDNMEHNYNSQALRAGLEGQAIWYNDSGHVFGYTTPDKNAYYFFADGNETATWMTSNGSNVGDALSRFGKGTVSIDGSTIKSVNNIFGDWKLFALTGGMNESLGTYEWTMVDDMYSEKYSMCHYLVLTQKDSVERKTWYYGSDGEYTFTDNVGDRSLIGVTLMSDSGETIVGTTGIKVSGASDNEILAGSKISLESKVFPDNATNRFVFWITSDRSVATVNDMGVVTGVSDGVAVITAITHDGGFSSSFTVKVVLSKTSVSDTVNTVNQDGSVTVTTGSVTSHSDGSTIAWTSESTSRGGKVIQVKNTSVTKKADGSDTTTITTIGYEGGTTTISSGKTTIVAENGIIQMDVSELSLTSPAVGRDTLTKAQRDRIGNANLYDITLSSGSANVTKFDGYVTITIENAVTKGADPSKIKVWYVGTDGTLEEMDFKYASSTGTVSFQTDHLSTYAVSFEEPERHVLAVAILALIVAVIAATIMTTVFYHPRRE